MREGSVLEKVYQQAGDLIGLKYCYISFNSVALQFALLACTEAEIAFQNGITPERLLIDLEKEAPLMEELRQNLEDMITEFDCDRDVRYSGYISELLHVEEVKSRMNYVICDRRRIYCDIYLWNFRE